MSESKLTIIYKKDGRSCKVEIHGEHGVNWPAVFKETQHSVMESLETQYENEMGQVNDDLLKHISELSKVPVEDLKKELEETEGCCDAEKYTRIAIKYLKKELDSIIKKD